MKEAEEWAEEYPEAVWREWAPETGVYMNKINCFNLHWEHDFYGVYYDKLLAVKRKSDPRESLYVMSGSMILTQGYFVEWIVSQL